MEDKHFNPLSVIKEALTVIAVLIVVFGWTMLVQLIISFVALSYITIKLKTMFIIASAVSLLFSIVWEVSRIRKRKKYNSIL